jgi:hypothetical protein
MFKREIDWAIHIGLHAVLLPKPEKQALFNFASMVNGYLDEGSYTQVGF